MPLPLTREKGLIFRIAHIDNLPWLLENGLQCRSSERFDPAYRNIGNPELIQKRTTRVVPVAPGGTLSDYVPFYFTSRSPMLYNIKTGRSVPAIPMAEIVVFVASLPRLTEIGLDYVFSDRHAYLATAQFSNDIADLTRIDWSKLAASDFSYDPNDPEKMDRYQAEALVHREVAIENLQGIICNNAGTAEKVAALVANSGHSTKVITKSQYFF